MYRLFIGIPVADDVKQAVINLKMNIPGARWIQENQMHITLKFIGEVDGVMKSNILNSLGDISCKPFSLRLKGTGYFPPAKIKRGRGPRILWAGMEQGAEIIKLRNIIEKRMSDCGIPRDSRKFFPHLTLARMKNPPVEAVMTFIKAFGGFISDPFYVDRFILYSSILRREGPLYMEEGVFPLENSLS